MKTSSARNQRLTTSSLEDTWRPLRLPSLVCFRQALTLQTSIDRRASPPKPTASPLFMPHTKTVLVTGASRGIGLAFVELYMKKGWNVIATARNLDTADDLKALNPHKLVQLDTCNEASIQLVAETLSDEAIDLLINNAGVGRDDTIESATKSTILLHFETNAVGSFLVTRALLPNLRAAVAINGAAVVGQVSSVLGSVTDNQLNTSGIGSGGLYGYRASKAALNMITANFALDLQADKIRVVALHPGYVATAMTAFTGPVTTQQSVTGMSGVLASVGEEESGQFLGFDGVTVPW